MFVSKLPRQIVVSDPTTKAIMKKFGLSRETPLFRVAEPQYLNVKTGTLAGNSFSIAEVSDYYQMIENPLFVKFRAAGLPTKNVPKTIPKEVNADSLGPSLNVSVRKPNIYSKAGDVMVQISLGDLLDRGGKIYPDTGAFVEGIKPFIITFEGEVPYTIVPQ